MSKKELTPDLLVKKENLAIMASNVRKYKKDIVGYQKELIVTKDDKRRNDVLSLLKTVSELHTNVSRNFRHLHVAYCELLGTHRSRIEQKTVRAKPLDQNMIDRLSKQFSQDGLSAEETEKYLNG